MQELEAAYFEEQTTGGLIALLSDDVNQLEYFLNCIYVMEHGQFTESGTHQQLLENDGMYAKLWRVQSGVL